jgi:peroxiredoxin
VRRDPSRLRRFSLQLLVLVAVVASVQAWRTRALLPLDERAAAPDFRMLDLEGRAWSTESLAGRPAVVYFFAPWCGVCAASSPQLRWFHRWRGDDVQLLLVGLDWSDIGELREYATKHRMPMPVLVGDDAIGHAYRVRGYPTYYVLDAQGHIAGRDTGLTTLAGLWLRTLRP